jgi:hypothetical protein
VDRDAVPGPEIAARDHLLLGYVIDDVDSFPSRLVIAKIVVERHLDDIAPVDQGDSGWRGRHMQPARGRCAIVQKVIKPYTNRAFRNS